jgi:hypothetical protein
MLAGESLAFDDMREVLERSGFVSDGPVSDMSVASPDTGASARIRPSEAMS